MIRILPVAVSFALVLPVLGSTPAEARKRMDPIKPHCGVEPVRDPAVNAPVARANRALAKIKANQAKVFKAYRQQYDSNRQRIIDRNKRLPKKQHLPIPPKRSDSQLRASAEYKNRARDVGADASAESAAQNSIDAAKRAVAQQQNAYSACKNGILKRMRTANTKQVGELLAIPKAKRLREETSRLAELKRIHTTKLAERRKSKGMGPILSSGICARKNMQSEIDREIRTTKKAARSSGTDATAKVEELKEARRSLQLDIIELKRDFKLLKLRRVSCRRRTIKPLSSCVEAKVRAARATGVVDVVPSTCKDKFEAELELLGLWTQPFE